MNDSASVQTLKDRHRGDAAWIVGKGPSLAGLAVDHLGPGPILAINEAVIAVERLPFENTIYSIQKDADDYDPLDDNSAFPWKPRPGATSIIPLKRAALLVHQHESANRGLTYRPRLIFDNVRDFDLDWWEFSGLTAIALARLMGCSKVVLVCFDACAHGDCRTCTPVWDGGQDSNAVSAAYFGHCLRLDEYLTRVAMPAQWLTPGHGPPLDHGDRRLTIDQLRGVIAESRRDAQRLHALADDRGREIERLTETLGKTAETLDQTTRALAQATHALGQANDNGQRLTALLDRQQASADASIQSLTSELAEARTRVHDLLGSASWRWMAPLRAVKRLLTRSK